MKDTVILVTSEGLGKVPFGDRSFGIEMFEKFLHTVETLPDKPTAICFYTDGVKLTTTLSPVLPALQLLEGMGVKMVVCKSCVDHFGLSEIVGVGSVGGMKDIVDLMAAAAKVITV